MDVNEALNLLEEVIYKPDWTVTATDHTSRFQDSVCIRVDYKAFNTNRALARKGYPEIIDTYATFPLIVGDIVGEDELWMQGLKVLLAIETHESREFFRIKREDFRAPFHPHRIEGMNKWPTDPMVDLQFGIA